MILQRDFSEDSQDKIFVHRWIGVFLISLELFLKYKKKTRGGLNCKRHFFDKKCCKFLKHYVLHPYIFKAKQKSPINSRTILYELLYFHTLSSPFFLVKVPQGSKWGKEWQQTMQNITPNTWFSCVRQSPKNWFRTQFKNYGFGNYKNTDRGDGLCRGDTNPLGHYV